MMVIEMTMKAVRTEAAPTLKNNTEPSFQAGDSGIIIVVVLILRQIFYI